AGLIGQLRTSAVKSAIVGQTLADIAALEAEGLVSGFKRTGSLRLALRPEREAEIREQVTAARRFGVDATLVGAADVARLAPGLEAPKEHPAAWMPNDGYAEPYTLATAYASAARRLGATFATGCDVLDIRVADGRARGVTAHAPGLMEIVPGLAEAPVVGGTAGVPTYTPDGHFVVGALPGVAGLFVATGCCAHGIAGSGSVGRAVAEAVTGAAATLDPTPM